MARDRGSVTAFFVGLVPIFVLSAGLALDGARVVAGRVAVGDHAENAARLAAQEVELIRLGWRVIDPLRATEVARSYLSEHGVDGSVSVGPRTVTVVARLEVEPTLLGVIGQDPWVVQESRTAEITDS
ncbi:MAG: pilus assembly protein TadG-related protein [Ilumatobacteraceae bacterium]